MHDIVPFSTDLTGAQTRPWVPHFLINRPTPVCKSMSVHVSGLLPGKCPHLPHIHPEEEFLIVLKGTADLVIATGPTEDGARVDRVGPGDGVYYPPTQYHTIRNRSDEPIEYLMLKWVAEAEEVPRPMLRFSYSSQRDTKGFSPLVSVDAPSVRLRRIHTHLTLLAPGKGYKMHPDPYDVAIVLLEGEIQTMGRVLAPRTLIYYDRGVPHDMKNVGSGIARYVVFEFESHV